MTLTKNPIDMPPMPDYEDPCSYEEGSYSYVQELHGVWRPNESAVVLHGVWRPNFDVHSTTAPLTRIRSPLRVSTAEFEVKLIHYGEGLVIVDFGEPESAFPEEHLAVVNLLRNHGRHLFADRLIDMLQNVRDDPDATINIISLRDMARFLVEHDFKDPAIGPDRRGIVHAQWRISGNGVLIMGFLGNGDILLVAQGDETPDSDELDISTRRPEPEILEEYGHLVPRLY